MERSTSIVDTWVNDLKISIIEDNEKKIHEMCTNIPEELLYSTRLEEACTLVSGAIENFKNKKEETRKSMNALAQTKRYLGQRVPQKRRLDIQS
jgi:hypothetical protein